MALINSPAQFIKVYSPVDSITCSFHYVTVLRRFIESYGEIMRI